MFRTSLRQLLSVPTNVIRDVYGVDVGPGFDLVGEAASGEDTVAGVRASQPDLLLIDLSMPRLSGIEALRALHTAGQMPKAIVLAAVVEKIQLLSAVRLGVRGVVLKDATTELLFEAIMSVLAGRSWLGKTLVPDLMDVASSLARESGGAVRCAPFGLTRREREVLTHVVAGMANKEIARQCAVSEETIKHHLTRMFDKVGASNRLELAVVATQSGLVESQ